MSTPTEYPKKYWWLILIVVPIVVALIAIIPPLINKPEKTSGAINISSTEFSGDMDFANIEVIINQYEQIQGQPLNDEKLKGEIERAVNLVKGGFYEKAIPVFKQVAEQSNLPAIYNNLGVLYAVTKDFDNAREAYSKAVEQNPDYQPVQLNLGLLEERQGRVKEAKWHFEKAPDLEEARQLGHLIEEQMGQGLIEAEPNNEIRSSNLIPLDKWVQGAIESDGDYFTFTTPETFRDIVKVDIKNQSTTLQPNLAVYSEKKQKLWDNWGGKTPGQDVEYSFSVNPDTVYHISIGGSYSSKGTYQVKITPLKVYDAYEPNDTILHAKPISLEKSIEANRMDSSDGDYYSIKTSPKGTSVAILIKNQSATLQPNLAVFSENKQKLWDNWGGKTPGQDVEYSFSVKPNSVYYIAIGGSYGSTGDYRLTVSEKSEDVTGTGN